MPLILYTLFAVSFLPILLAWVGGYFRFRQFETFDNHYPRLQQAQMQGIGARVQAAQMNAWEALIIYTAVNLIAFASGLDLNTLDTVACAYLGLRILHGVFYLADWAWTRSSVFALGMFCCLYIVYRAATHAAV